MLILVVVILFQGSFLPSLYPYHRVEVHLPLEESYRGAWKHIAFHEQGILWHYPVIHLIDRGFVLLTLYYILQVGDVQMSI